MELPKRYDPKESEPKWQKFWEEQNIYAFDKESDKDIYSIDTPPPTVSGRMHIGHAYSFSQQDFVARFQRMLGKNVFCPFGTDDNGLATEKLVQKHKKVNLRKINRVDAIKTCIEFLDEERPKFIQDWKNIGMSCDFSIKYSTIDDHSRKLSQKTFIDLAKKGLAYRKKGPVAWDRVFQTAIAQAELENKTLKSTLNFIKAKIKEEDNTYVIYATTRPELLYGCVGVSVQDKGDYVTLKVGNEFWITGKNTYQEKFKDFEYEVIGELKGQDFIGKTAIIPIANREVPINHDLSVEADYGTGIVYFCTYGGLDCVEWMSRNPECKPVELLNKDGTLNEKNGAYQGMITTDARPKILEDLEKDGSLVKKESVEHVVNVGERSGAEVEYIVSEQWYIKYLDQKEHFLQAGSELNWFPTHMKHRLDNWIKGLNWDWSISRQRHFGVPIPIWYDKNGKVYYADESQLPVDPTTTRPKGVPDDLELTAETDVFDTWFTSGSSPSLARELMPKEIQGKLTPTNLRPQAHDIINFWLFYTLAKTQLLTGENPWKDVIISGFALDPHGKKMSKSKGNVVAPQDMIEKFSADALRFWAAGSRLGDDLPFQEKDLVTGTKFSTKLWNASKFCFMHLENYKKEEPKELDMIDKWILSKLSAIVKSSTDSFTKYEYSKTKLDVETFFWHTFCDQYLELVKDRLYNPDTRGEPGKLSGQYGLYQSLLSILKLMAPIMPHITEELYQGFFKEHENDKSIHLSSWPTLDMIDPDADAAGDFAVEVVSHVRKAKSEQNLSLKSPVKKIVCHGKISKKQFEAVKADIVAATKAEAIEFSELEKDSEKAVEIDIQL